MLSQSNGVQSGCTQKNLEVSLKVCLHDTLEVELSDKMIVCLQKVKKYSVWLLGRSVILFV